MPDTPCARCGTIGFVRHEHIITGGQVIVQHTCGRCHFVGQTEDVLIGAEATEATGRKSDSTDALHVIERFHRKDFGHMDIQITIDDPKAYTKPWTVAQSVNVRPDSVLVEFVCNENNFVGKS